MVTADFRDDLSVAYETRKELGPEYERAVLESFVAGAAESIDRRVDARLARHGQERQPDNSYVAVPVFSLLFGVGGSIWLTAGAHAEADAVFAMWLGIVLLNLVFARLVRRLHGE
ncbi:hypothetical protein [Jiangella sp. DSM 45060]|uniref:hypothetical protein n=1 Tax=Jiangella sp. DSM 45060 TaxID=1798224 RepID=UPI00087D3E4F|nr:hypothetical protein [Jiangella sp. DSM 45060]SDS60677.1 hypothetical protein SAMN04515669_1476 [Jiangella sp. DSM 45060]